MIIFGFGWLVNWKRHVVDVLETAGLTISEEKSNYFIPHGKDKGGYTINFLGFSFDCVFKNVVAKIGEAAIKSCAESLKALIKHGNFTVTVLIDKLNCFCRG